MRLLMTSAGNPLYLAYHYYEGLSGIPNLKLMGFDHNDQFNVFYNKHFFNKVIHKTFSSYIFNQISQKLEEQVDKFQPEVIWLFKGMEIRPQTLEKLKKKGCRLVNYNLDHPFEFASKGSGNQNVRDAIELYDLHISYSRHIIHQLNTKFPNLSTAYLPFGHALQEEVFDQVEQESEINSVCFIGEPDENRANFIRSIVDQQLSIHVYGRNWAKFLTPSKAIQINPPVFGSNYWRTLRKYRVQLNIFRPHNKGSHNMRSFEIPAVGGIMLAPRTQEHQASFTEGKEAFYYESKEETLEQIRLLLNMDMAASQQIRQNARKRSIDGGYSYTCRAQQAYQILSHLE